MTRSISVALALGFVFHASSVFAQASPMQEGPLGTPMTPGQMGAWMAPPGLSEAEAEYDARAQGYHPRAVLREDHYGDWIGRSSGRGFIVFPDGRAYPL